MKDRLKNTRNLGDKRALVRKRITDLFDEAKKAFKQDKIAANNSVRKARRLSMKYKVDIPKELKMHFCKHCYSYLVLGGNCRVRTRNGKLVYYCLECKNFTRVPYKK